MTIIVVISRKAFCDFVTTSTGHDRFAVALFFLFYFSQLLLRIVHSLFGANFSMRSIRCNNRPRETRKKMKTEKKALEKHPIDFQWAMCRNAVVVVVFFLSKTRRRVKSIFATNQWTHAIALETFWDDRFHPSTTMTTNSVAQKIATLPQSFPMCVAIAIGVPGNAQDWRENENWPSVCENKRREKRHNSIFYYTTVVVCFARSECCVENSIDWNRILTK